MAREKALTTKQQLEELREIAFSHDRQIEGLIRAMKIERQTVSTLAASIVAHDNQIEGLIRLTEKNSKDIARIERQWQAYLNRLPPQ
jgi:hypothetical protein